MIKIAPSILSADFAHLARDIAAISSADYVHVDVMDGLFVPNISIGIPVVKSIRPTTTLPLDIHLMIDRPVRYVEQFCDAGGDLITCHVEADTEENILAAIDKIHAKGKKAGVVVKPKTPASAVLPFIDKVELILVMTVEPGFGGQKFMADMMPKVQTIRGYIDAMNPACELEVDGGVDTQTCKLCIASGANVLVAPQWLVALPLTAVLALALNADPWFVSLAIQAESFIKCPICLWRVRSKKWIHDVTLPEGAR